MHIVVMFVSSSASANYALSNANASLCDHSLSPRGSLELRLVTEGWVMSSLRVFALALQFSDGRADGRL